MPKFRVVIRKPEGPEQTATVTASDEKAVEQIISAKGFMLVRVLGPVESIGNQGTPKKVAQDINYQHAPPSDAPEDDLKLPLQGRAYPKVNRQMKWAIVATAIVVATVTSLVWMILDGQKIKGHYTDHSPSDSESAKSFKKPTAESEGARESKNPSGEGEKTQNSGEKETSNSTDQTEKDSSHLQTNIINALGMRSGVVEMVHNGGRQTINDAIKSISTDIEDGNICIKVEIDPAHWEKCIPRLLVVLRDHSGNTLNTFMSNEIFMPEGNKGKNFGELLGTTDHYAVKGVAEEIMRTHSKWYYLKGNQPNVIVYPIAENILAFTKSVDVSFISL